MSTNPPYVAEPALARKARGAFFTPQGITRHLAEWAIRHGSDRVLEPSAGEAAFLLAAVAEMQSRGVDVPEVYGVELHPRSAQIARDVIGAAGGNASIRVSDFFLVEPAPEYDAVIGNPPFIRYQAFGGEARDRARFAALQQGVALTGLASSWAAFVVHAASHLKQGGRLGMVLPAELLSVNYAAPVRRFLLERFSSVELITFEEQVFPDAEADTVLVKADGWGGPSAGYAKLRQARNAETLAGLEVGTTWAPIDTTDRWSPLPLATETIDVLASSVSTGAIVPLGHYGETSLGAVTGANRFFTLSPERARGLGIPRRDMVRISPPGSRHLRGLTLSKSAVTRLGQAGYATWLLRPSDRPADATLHYIEIGHETGVDQAYKCRVRSPWWRVPVLAAPDLLLTYMNADTPRLTTNSANVLHLNSVHGVYLREEMRNLARETLPIASLNSLTVLAAELVGRSYGGGILKIEPREADRWWMPSPQLLSSCRTSLLEIKPTVLRLLQSRNLLGAIEAVDQILLKDLPPMALATVRQDHRRLMERRMTRGRRGRAE